jgi:hypothetical protein
MEKNFNKSNDRPRFTHKPNPLVERAWHIFEFIHHKNDYEPVGEYILINQAEDPEITEKKLINLISLINGKKDIIDLTNLTKTRVLYNVVPEAQSGNQTKIVFRDYDGSGVSKDNAIFTIRKGVFTDG